MLSNRLLKIPKRSILFTVKRILTNPFDKPVTGWLTDLPTCKPVSFIQLDRMVFGAAPRPDLIHQVEKWYRTGIRAGTACTKTKAEVSGSNAKGRPQKYTGRARMGCKRAPHFRKGGVSHGPKPRSFEYKLNHKIRNAALRVALSAKHANDQIVFCQDECMNDQKKLISMFSHQHQDDKLPLELHKREKVLILDTLPLQVQEISLPERVKFFNVVFDAAKEFKKRKVPGRNIPFRLRELKAYHVLHAKKIVMSERAARFVEAYTCQGLI
jgi:50S ribosomal protein L4